MQKVTGAGKTTVDFAKDGTPVAAPGVPQVSTDGGLPKVEQTGNVRNPSGNAVPVKVTGRIPGVQTALAVGRALGRVVGPVAAGMAIWEVCKELGFGCSRTADSGLITITREDPDICTVSPCSEYLYSQSSTITSGWRTSRASACTALANSLKANIPTYSFSGSVSGNICVMSYTTPSGDVGEDAYHLATRIVDPAPSNAVPASQQELLDAVAAKSGWPSTSAIAEVIAQSNTIGGPKVQPQAITVSGPATSPGTTTTTNNTTNNTTKAETTTHNHTYQGDTITTTTLTNTVITNNLGDVISNETKTETPPEDTRGECEKNPQSLNCSELDTPEGEIPKSTKNITYSPENLFGGGSCPANHTITTSAGKQIVLSYQPTCDAFSVYIRPMIIAIALYMAYLIILPGAKV